MATVTEERHQEAEEVRPMRHDVQKTRGGGTMREMLKGKISYRSSSNKDQKKMTDYDFLLCKRCCCEVQPEFIDLPCPSCGFDGREDAPKKD